MANDHPGRHYAGLTSRWDRLELSPGNSGGMTIAPSIRPRTETHAGLDRWRTDLSLIVRDAPYAAVAAVLREEVMRMETSISRFRDDSELSFVNRSPGRWVSVSRYFVDVLAAALEAAAWTDGLVDPTVGAAVDAAGYRAWRAGGVPLVTAGPQPSSGDAWRDVEITPTGSHARVRIPPGTSLDLGAVAKGWLADRVARRAVDQFDADSLANMGGDLRAIARDEPWAVTVDPESTFAGETEFELWDGAIATSGVGRRAWTTADGRAAHHIIDPRTGAPADTPWRTCSVLAASAATANAASTAGIILGVAGPAWVGRQRLDAWFVGESTSQRVGQWPTEE